MTSSFYPTFVSRTDQNGITLYTAADRAAIEETVSKLAQNRTTDQRPGVLLGKIQSGKTRCFLAVMALAFDQGYDITIVLTKGTVALARQTLLRIEQDFHEFVENDEVRVLDVMSTPDNLSGFTLSKKLVFVVKKQTDNLDRLSRLLFTTYPSLGGRRVLVIDDEADNASVGYSKQKDEEVVRLRKIADQINELRLALDSSSFLQVTATPYALYLQPEESPLGNGAGYAPVRPSFTVSIPEHDKYIGGRFYFEDSKIAGSVASHVFSPVEKEELDALRREDGRVLKLDQVLESLRVASLRKALVTFVAGGVIRILQSTGAGKKAGKFSFLVHTEAGKSAHEWQTSVVEALATKLKESAIIAPAVFNQLFSDAYTDLSSSISAAGQPLPDFDAVLTRAREALVQDHITIATINSERDIDPLLDKSGQLRLESPLNVFVGGQILDRGITIAGLIGFFYGRNPKRFQQDTVLQHSRMYGARPPADCAVTRFYTTPGIYAAMAEMHEMDEELRQRIVKAGDDQRFTFIELSESGRVVHCSPNKILAAVKVPLRPGKRFAPIGFQTDYKTRLEPVTNQINEWVASRFGTLDDSTSPEKAVEIPLSEALEFFDLMNPMLLPEEGYESFWDVAELKAILRHLSESAKTAAAGKVWLMIRTNRNRKRLPDEGESPFDTPDNPRIDTAHARAVAKDLPVLMLLRQNGAEAEGWRGCPFWWPVVFTPQNVKPAIFAKR
jgi:hypothetical protein